MNDMIAIYQTHVQSADKLDERRDASVRSCGGMCVVLTAASVGTFAGLPWLSAALWILLAAVAIGWLAILDSLTAKLTAKNRLLAEMEQHKDMPIAFLTGEREKWDSLAKPPLVKALRRAPWAFIAFAAVGLSALARVAWLTVCVCE